MVVVNYGKHHFGARVYKSSKDKRVRPANGVFRQLRVELPHPGKELLDELVSFFKIVYAPRHTDPHLFVVKVDETSAECRIWWLTDMGDVSVHVIMRLHNIHEYRCHEKYTWHRKGDKRK